MTEIKYFTGIKFLKFAKVSSLNLPYPEISYIELKIDQTYDKLLRVRGVRDK